MNSPAICQTQLPAREDVIRGKVRDIYDLGDQLMLVATDRISAFDWVNPVGIPARTANNTHDAFGILTPPASSSTADTFFFSTVLRLPPRPTHVCPAPACFAPNRQALCASLQRAFRAAKPLPDICLQGLWFPLRLC